MKFTILALALALPAALATCPNDCSNNGHCNHFSACECHRNWMGNDCSMRVCYFDRAFVDTPAGDLNSNGILDALNTVKTMSHNVPNSEQFPSSYGLGQDFSTDIIIADWSEAHFHAECSGKGICERETGQCACFEGYEGEGCTRVACASSTDKSCSGHGTCHRLKDLYKPDSDQGGYLAWDGAKTQQCVCDAGYTGLKCDQRVCPSGDDPVTKYVKYITVCGTSSDPAGIAEALDNKVYGTMTGASATVAIWATTGKPSRALDVPGSDSNSASLINYPNCIALIAEEGLFAVGEALITKEKKYLVNSTNIVHREHSAEEQKNEIQMVVVKSTDEFALVYTDELGSVYTTRTIKCNSADPDGNSDSSVDAAEAAVFLALSDVEDCKDAVEDALEELPHMVATDIDVTVQSCGKGAGYTAAECVTGSCSDSSLTSEADCDAAGTCAKNDGSASDGEATESLCDAASDAADKTWIYAGNVWTAAGVWHGAESTYGHINLQVEFISNTGDEILMTAISTVEQVAITEKRKGTTENAICGERGICDYTTGICKCFPGFTNVDCAKQNVLAVW